MSRAGVEYAICGLGAAVTAIGRLAWWSRRRQAATDESGAAARTPAPLPRDRSGTWSEGRSRQLLADAGVPVVPAVLCTTADEAVAAAAQFAGPVAIKVASEQIVHKTDVGAVELGVAGPAGVRAAFADVMAAGRSVPGATLDGVLVSPMRRGGAELLVGVIRDPDWGLLLTVAMGGVLVEVLRDVALTPLPARPERIRELLASLRGAELLRGVRGAPPADIGALVDAITRIADLAQALGDELESLEVNPLLVTDRGVEALDALVIWRDPATNGVM
jgi:acyl-CoA synthetase (NDP forming)